MECSHRYCYMRTTLIAIIGVLIGFGIAKFYLQKKLITTETKETTIIQQGSKENCQETLKLTNAMRKLWSDHVFWTRLYIISAVRGNEDSKLILERLMKNQEDIGQAIVPYYGQKAGQELTKLLKEDISIEVAIITAAVKKQKNAFENENKKWFKNAEQIAQFLSQANPNWPKEEMVKLLNDHLKLTTDELTTRVNKKWKDDIKTFDKIYDQALSIADSLTNGIIKQQAEKKA